MNVSNRKYIIPTVGPMHGWISFRGKVWLTYLAALLLCLLAPWVLL